MIRLAEMTMSLAEMIMSLAEMMMSLAPSGIQYAHAPYGVSAPSYNFPLLKSFRKTALRSHEHFI